MRSTIFLLACVVLQNACWDEREPSYQPSNGDHTIRTKQQKGPEMNKETAIVIAREHAVRTYRSLEAYNIVACEQTEVWRVFLEPKNIRINQRGAWYAISKHDGKVVIQDEFRLNAAASANQETTSAQSTSIKKESAIAIGRRDASKAYRSLSLYDLWVCELTEMWSIIFLPKSGLNGGGPEYLIDKKTGQILHKRYYQ